jgi:hypothetical protein
LCHTCHTFYQIQFNHRKLRVVVMCVLAIYFAHEFGEKGAPGVPGVADRTTMRLSSLRTIFEGVPLCGAAQPLELPKTSRSDPDSCAPRPQIGRQSASRDRLRATTQAMRPRRLNDF